MILQKSLVDLDIFAICILNAVWNKHAVYIVFLAFICWFIMHYFLGNNSLLWLGRETQEKYRVRFCANLSKQNVCRSGLAKPGFNLIASRSGHEEDLGQAEISVDRSWWFKCGLDGHLLKNRERKEQWHRWQSMELRTSLICSGVERMSHIQAPREGTWASGSSRMVQAVSSEPMMPPCWVGRGQRIV